MADISPLGEPELRDLERRLTELALPPSRHERERLLYACGQAAGRAQMQRRVRAAISFAALCLAVSFGLGLTLLARGGSQTAAVENAFAQTTHASPAAPSIEWTSIDERARAERSDNELTATSGFQQLIASEKARTFKPQAAAIPHIPSQRILTAADSSLPDEL
jgi:hypothetical protein